MMTFYLSANAAMRVVERLGFHARDAGLLASALARPQASFGGSEVYPEIHDKAAVLLESLTRNHPLFDGNKRTGWVLTMVFLELNGFDLIVDEDAAFEHVIGVASGQIDAEASGRWFEERLESFAPR